jgi:tyrosyl-tRNA synthetase
MTQEEKFNILTRGIAEVVTPEEAKELLSRGGEPKAYWGIEPSGWFHIGQALIGARKVRDLAELGFRVNILLADWHALINDKLDGTFDTIQTCGRYLEDCLRGLGADSPNIHYLVGSDLVDGKEYWERVIRISKASSVATCSREMWLPSWASRNPWLFTGPS